MSSLPTPAHPCLPLLRARVIRSGFAESEHLAEAVLVNPEGQIVLAWGDPHEPRFPRSSIKPLLAVGMVRAGLALREERLAIVSSSHNGQPEHVELVAAILQAAALSESDLANTPALPSQVHARDAWLAAGRGPQRITQNCSGKHAGMLLTAQALGVPTQGYTAWEHPVQRAVVAAVREFTGDPCQTHGIDGCGAPVVAITLVGLARAFSRLIQAPPGSPEHAVTSAMSNHAFYVGGSDRDVTVFMDAVPGAIAKDGAEGLHALALPDGTALALKVRDGTDRARPAFVAAILRELGMAEVAAALPVEPVLGGGSTVGHLEVEVPS